MAIVLPVALGLLVLATGAATQTGRGQTLDDTLGENWKGNFATSVA
jgi:hypothetical protein